MTLWLLEAWGYDEEEFLRTKTQLIVAKDEAEARKRFDEIFPDEWWNCASIKPVRFVDGYEIAVKEILH
jgi:hypothetical protein